MEMQEELEVLETAAEEEAVEEEVVEESADESAEDKEVEESADEVVEDEAEEEEVEAKTLTQKLVETESKADELKKAVEDAEESLKQGMAAKDAEIAELKDKVERMIEQAEEREELIAKMEVEVGEALQRVEDMKSNLGNPAAFNEAVNGEQTPVEEGGEADAEGGLYRAFMAIADPKEKTAFWKKHQAELQDEMKQIAGGI